ncbi:hypothetical protein LSAT2_012123, partial [Lamellibrachia satsuma]
MAWPCSPNGQEYCSTRRSQMDTTREKRETSWDLENCWRRYEDAWEDLEKNCWRRYEDVWEDLEKNCWRKYKDVWEDLEKNCWRRYEDAWEDLDRIVPLMSADAVSFRQSTTLCAIDPPRRDEPS